MNANIKETLEKILNVKITGEQMKQITAQVLVPIHDAAWLKGCESGTNYPWR